MPRFHFQCISQSSLFSPALLLLCEFRPPYSFACISAKASLFSLPSVLPVPQVFYTVQPSHPLLKPFETLCCPLDEVQTLPGFYLAFFAYVSSLVAYHFSWHSSSTSFGSLNLPLTLFPWLTCISPGLGQDTTFSRNFLDPLLDYIALSTFPHQATLSMMGGIYLPCFQ